MIGRRYTVRGQLVRVLVRWGAPSREFATSVCDECGATRTLNPTTTGVRVCCDGGMPPELWPFPRLLNSGPRNVLVEPIHAAGLLAGYPSGVPFVRPFRGLRRA